MKKLLLFVTLSFGVISFAQGRSVSLKKKSFEPIELSDKSILKVEDIIFFKIGTGVDGKFLFVQDLNNFNEPIQPSKSRTAMQKQPVKFFKIQDGVLYAFTKYYCINVEAAILSKEIEIILK